MARSAALKRSVKASDAARRSLLAADRAGEDYDRAGAREESRDTPPSALENAKRGLIRRTPARASPSATRFARGICQPNGRRVSRRFWQDCDPTAYSCMPRISPEAEGRTAKRALAGCRKDAEIARHAQGARLPRM